MTISQLKEDMKKKMDEENKKKEVQQAAAADNAAELFCDQLYNYSHNLNGTKLKPQMTITSLSKILNAMSHPLFPPSTSFPPPAPRVPLERSAEIREISSSTDLTCMLCNPIEDREFPLTDSHAASKARIFFQCDTHYRSQSSQNMHVPRNSQR